MKLFITGVSGFIGAELAATAVAAGHEVVGMARREWLGAPHLPLGNRYFGELPFDIPEHALEGIDAIVHCAALRDGGDKQVWSVNLLGTEILAQRALEARVKNFVFISTQSAHEGAVTCYGRSKFAAEQYLLRLRGIDVVIIRPGLVCGPGSVFAKMAQIARSFPILPLVGGDAVVQPIWVGDLAEAVVSVAEGAGALPGQILEVGNSRPLRLREFVRALASAQTGQRKRVVDLPIRPLAYGAGIAERLRLQLPITRTNLIGASAVRQMTTADDMERLGVPERRVSEIVDRALHYSVQWEQAKQEPGPTKTLVIGAGRIGLVHALTLSRLPGKVLGGVADLNRRATKLLLSIGVKVNIYRSAESALAEGGFGAAIVATPPVTHLPLAELSLSAGVPVLIEKPACANEEQLARLRLLGEESKAAVAVGYFMPGMPHLREWLRRLASGEYGRPRYFVGLTLISFIRNTASDRWEIHPELSGGGVLSNSSGHTLSLIHAAFGKPSRIQMQTRKTLGLEVEDSAMIDFDYGDFTGVHIASWCVDGFSRQENRLVVWTDRGRVTLSPSACLFEQEGHDAETSHQLDYPVGFNLAPDYIGAGISSELELLAAGSNGAGHPMTLGTALDIEEIMFSAYRSAREVEQFEFSSTSIDLDAPLEDSAALSQPNTAAKVNRIADLRELEGDAIDRLNAEALNGWHELLVFSGSAEAACRAVGSQGVRVTVPNFLLQTRQIQDKRYLELLGSLGPVGILSAARTAMEAAAVSRNLGFWPAARALLSGELANMRPDFDGTILLHPYLVDLAAVLGRTGDIEAMINSIRKRCPGARVGLHSNLATRVMNLFSWLEAKVECLSLLASPVTTLESVRERLDALEWGHAVELTAEVGPAPLVLHRLAYADPAKFSSGASSLLLNGIADGVILEAQKADLKKSWNRGLPGVPGLGLAL